LQLKKEAVGGNENMAAKEARKKALAAKISVSANNSMKSEKPITEK